MGEGMPNDASAQKAGSAQYDDYVLFVLFSSLSPGCHCPLYQPFVPPLGRHFVLR